MLAQTFSESKYRFYFAFTISAFHLVNVQMIAQGFFWKPLSTPFCQAKPNTTISNTSFERGRQFS